MSPTRRQVHARPRSVLSQGRGYRPPCRKNGGGKSNERRARFSCYGFGHACEGSSDAFLEGNACRPAELVPGFGRIKHRDRHVEWPSWLALDHDRLSQMLLKNGNEVVQRTAFPTANIERGR